MNGTSISSDELQDCSDLYAESFDVVGSVGSARKVREVELDLVPAIVKPHRHRADKRLNSRRTLVVTGPETPSHILVIQHLRSKYY